MSDLNRMEKALRAYVLAQRRMLDGWAEGDKDVKTDLWKNLHACQIEGEEALHEAGVCIATGARVKEG